MLVKSTSESQDWSFVRFDLSSCGIPTSGGADTATLTLYVRLPLPAQPDAHGDAGALATWSSTLTWTTAQTLTYGAATTTIATGSANNGPKTTKVTVDVDSLIKNSAANYGWRITDAKHHGNATTTFATTKTPSPRAIARSW